jgi:serine/threonine-protein kinase RsbT
MSEAAWSADGAEVRVPVSTDSDIVTARLRGRELAAPLGFSSSQLTHIATAISELARNIVTYAQRGEISVQVIRNGSRSGIMIVARDQGPGIPDLARALQDGYSSSGSLGLGLPGSRRLMDEFEIESTVGQGTRVTLKKWAE